MGCFIISFVLLLRRINNICLIIGMNLIDKIVIHKPYSLEQDDQVFLVDFLHVVALNIIKSLRYGILLLFRQIILNVIL